jgi:hypothetical protein
MATTKKAKEETTIEIPGIKLKRFSLKLVGDSPLIVHAWSEKAKREMLYKQMKKATTGKDAKRPMVDFADALYWLTEKPDFTNMEDDEIMAAVQKGRFGFPVLAFKAAAIDGAYQQGAVEKKTTLRGAFHITGEYAEIKGKPPVIREDMVRIGMGTADIRYRPEFKEWGVTLDITYNEQAISAEQIVNIFNIGGFAVGIGEWRPAKDGRNGCYHVE